jgi:hypothetical protein
MKEKKKIVKDGKKKKVAGNGLVWDVRRLGNRWRKTFFFIIFFFKKIVVLRMIFFLPTKHVSIEKKFLGFFCKKNNNKKTAKKERLAHVCVLVFCNSKTDFDESWSA